MKKYTCLLKNLIFVAFLIMLVIAILSLFFAKFQLSIVRYENNDKNNSQITAQNYNGKEFVLHSKSSQALNTLVLVNASDNDDNEIVISNIRTVNNGAFVNFDKFVNVIPGWVIEEHDGYGWQLKKQFVSKTPNSKIIWDGYTSELYCFILLHPKGGKIEVKWNGDTKTIDTYRKNAKWEKLYLKSKKEIYYATIPISEKKIILKNIKNDVENITVTFGNLKLIDLNSVKNNDLEINFQNKLFTTVSYLILNGFVFIFKNCWLLFLYLIFGTPFTVKFFKNSNFIEKLISSIIVGYCFLISIGSSLTYVISIKTSMYIIIIITLIFYIVLIKIHSIPYFLDYFSIKKNEIKTVYVICCISLCSTLIYYFPAIIEPGWFFGHNLTDTYHYTNWSQKLLRNSAFSIDFYYFLYWRIAELVSFGQNSIFLCTNTRASYPIINSALWFTLPPLGFVLFSRLLKNQKIIFPAVILFSFASNLYSIFSQSYIAHYFFGFTLLYSLFFSIVFIQANKDIYINENVLFYIAIGVIFAANIALYSHQFLIPLSLIIFSLFYLKNNKHHFKNAVKLGVATILCTNINLLPTINFKSNSIYFDRLDAIGANIVFPFYNVLSTIFGEIIFGFRDFTFIINKYKSVVCELFNINLSNYVFKGISVDIYLILIKASSKLLVFIIFVLILVWIVSTVLKVKQFNFQSNLFILITFLLYSLFSIFLLVTNHPYAYGKMMMTVGVIIPIIAILSIDNMLELKAGKNFDKIFLSLIFFFYICLNLNTMFLDNALAHLNRNSVLFSELRTHIDTVKMELKELSHEIQENDKKEITKNKRYKYKGLIIGLLDEYEGTDKDRIIYNRIYHIFDNSFLHDDVISSKKELFEQVKNSSYLLVFNGYENYIDEIQCDLLIKNNLFSLYKSGSSAKTK